MVSSDNYSGQKIGSYLTLEKLGSGEFGSVYRAKNTLITEIVVAIKIINKKYASSPEECEKFIKEARMLRGLKHQYILPILDVGELQGKPYIVLEFAPSGSLRDYMELFPNRQMPLDQALTILSQIGAGLHFAHQKNTVHRDLKPANILLNTKGEAVLADFGVSVEGVTSTKSGVEVIGTPAYMAPEHFEGMLTKKSDQYALGCIAYELLTGTRPFHAYDYAGWAVQHRFEAPIPPRQHNPAIPIHVEQAILQAMAKDHKQRFVDVARFVAALTPQRIVSLAKTKTAPKSFVDPTVLGSADVTIGRAPDNVYPIKNDKEVSQYHAVIRPHRQGHVIIDKKSSNKTFVNAREIPPDSEWPLKPGDSIRVGRTFIEYPDDLVVALGLALVPKRSPLEPTKPASAKPHRGGRTLVFIVLIVLVIAASAGVFLYMGGNQSAQRSANATATAQTLANNQATATVVQATHQATSPFPLFGNLAFYDMLIGSSNSHWESSNACNFMPSGYEVSIAQHGGFQSCRRSSPTFKDFAVMVTMSIQQGDCGGITFRDVGVNYYVVLICSDGTYDLGRVKNGSKQWASAAMKAQLFSSAIHRGAGQQNIVAVVVQGNTFNLYVNDLTKVTHAFTDSNTPLGQGSIGLVASDLKNPTMVVYTNAVAWT